MAEIKTQINRTSVDKFLQGIRDEKKREECRQVVKIMKRATKAEPKMWGTSIVGFGSCHYIHESGQKIDWFLTGFSPCVQNLTVYLTGGFDRDMLKKLGKYKMGRNCLYISRLEDVDKRVLGSLITKSLQRSKANVK